MDHELKLTISSFDTNFIVDYGPPCQISTTHFTIVTMGFKELKSTIFYPENNECLIFYRLK